ncbi:sushi repeat-containing protein SRPX2-like [Mytilus galloprovincialis]|uniref:sushi repeat-containing protein SRPX2-like n=1 Tax=Mytilus galloprovincialis TaxID=29158 RepID=UPI003F7B9775
MFYEYRRCNDFCYNGGTSNSYVCDCVAGYSGECCGIEVTCGDLKYISNGYIDGNQFTYGNTIKYFCNAEYTLIEGSLTRTCASNGLWNGTKPRCAFFNSCNSLPCQNDGNCTNIPDNYICQCTIGWSGKNCEIDVQPPLVSNCSDNMKILTSDLTKSVVWTIPDFTDPHNTSLSITSNYIINHWTFPWGDYKISYSALKPVNGKVTECLFEIDIKPFPCPTLNVPLNGALLCNNWKTDYGYYCLYWCQEDNTVARGVDPSIWFVCGASGLWFPRASIPDCSGK